MPVRSRIIALTAVLSMAASASSEMAYATDNTRSQHREWIRKLEMGQAHLPSLEMEAEHEDQLILGPHGTVMQHRTWIKKLETPGGTLGTSL